MKRKKTKKKTRKDIVKEMRNQLAEVEHFLGHGYIKKVQAKLDYAVKDGTVTAVKIGQRDTIHILAAILSVAKEEKEIAIKALEQ